MNGQPLAHLVWILPLALLVVYVGSPRFLGTIGSSRVRRILKAALEKNRYTVISDLTLPAGGGTVHFDHIIVSQYGIHVIDTVHRSGWISGAEPQARWRQKLLGHFRTFDNPVHANYLRVQALERLLQLPLSRFHSVVVFSGHRGFKTTMPKNVVSGNKLIQKVRADSRQLLAPEEADRVVLTLQDAALKPAFLGRAGRWKLLRLLLLMVLIAGIYFVYGDAIRAVLQNLQSQANVRMAPEKYHSDGTPKSARESWEDGLICAYSVDTGQVRLLRTARSKSPDPATAMPGIGGAGFRFAAVRCRRRGPHHRVSAQEPLSVFSSWYQNSVPW